MSDAARRVSDPAELADLYGRRPDVHPYGLADLEEPLLEPLDLVPGG